MYWLEVSVVTDGEGAEAVAELLRPFAYNEGVVLEQLGDETDPDPNALEAAVTVKIFIPEAEDTPAIRHHLEEILYHMGRLYPLPPPTFQKLKVVDWANAWKVHYHPFRVGRRIWIQPSWMGSEAGKLEESGNRPDDVVLTLDPGMAFGTGLHPTTQMCLMALEKLIEPGMSLLDVGTGSAILAIAAAKLGAGSILGIDTDQVAVQTAEANSRQNDVSDRLTITAGTLDTVSARGWNIVVVNILAPVIIDMLEQDSLLAYVSQDGRLILGGIIDEQAESVETAVLNAGGQIDEIFKMRDWVTYTVRPVRKT